MAPSDTERWPIYKNCHALTCYTVLYMLNYQQRSMLEMSKSILCSSYKGFKPPDFFFALFPSVNPEGWNVPVLLQYLTGLKMCKECIRGRIAKRRHDAAHKKAFKLGIQCTILEMLIINSYCTRKQSAL